MVQQQDTYIVSFLSISDSIPNYDVFIEIFLLMR